MVRSGMDDAERDQMRELRERLETVRELLYAFRAEKVWTKEGGTELMIRVLLRQLEK